MDTIEESTRENEQENRTSDNLDKSILARDERKNTRMNELSVFTKAKDMVEYMFTILKNAPKQYRWNIVDRVLDNATQFVVYLFRANTLRDKERRDMQYQADNAIKVTTFFIELAQKFQVITGHQFQVAARHLYECRQALWGWIKCKN